MADKISKSSMIHIGAEVFVALSMSAWFQIQHLRLTARVVELESKLEYMESMIQSMAPRLSAPQPQMPQQMPQQPQMPQQMPQQPQMPRQMPKQPLRHPNPPNPPTYPKAPIENKTVNVPRIVELEDTPETSPNENTEKMLANAEIDKILEEELTELDKSANNVGVLDTIEEL
jgi:hypothetical protein